MYLTPDNVHKFLGKKLNASKSIFRCYPFTVIQYSDGTYATKDRNGICSPIDNIKFNQVWFDTVDGVKIE